jgi:Zn-dependent alcohol dehydrogenase
LRVVVDPKEFFGFGSRNFFCYNGTGTIVSNFIVDRYIVGVDINESKFGKAGEMGATECVNSRAVEGGDVKTWLLNKEKWGYDYTFDCTGNVEVMRCALEVAHRLASVFFIRPPED